MTQSQLKKANDLVYEIKEKRNQIDRIEDFTKRLEEITGPYQKYVKIKLGEQYIHTPEPEVQISKLRDLIAAQKTYFEEYIKNLEKEFEEL